MCASPPTLGLPERDVIDAVGPVWRGGEHGEAELFASCYRRSIGAARAFESLAFSAISTGVYGFPAPQAARIAVATAVDVLAEGRGAPRQVVFCFFLRELRQTPSGGLAGRGRGQTSEPRATLGAIEKHWREA